MCCGNVILIYDMLKCFQNVDLSQTLLNCFAFCNAGFHFLATEVQGL